jgi:hypothetical protein
MIIIIFPGPATLASYEENRTTVSIVNDEEEKEDICILLATSTTANTDT